MVDLKVSSRAMGVAAKLASLKLKPAKCVIVPLAGPFSTGLRQRVHHLGVWLGPAASLLQSWSAPWDKCRARVSAFAASAAPASLNGINYTTRCLPIMGYVAQFLPLSAKLKSQDIHVLVKLMRFPGGVLRQVDFHALGAWGGPRLRSLAISAKSALIRCGIVTHPEHATYLAYLKRASSRWINER
eukprot:3450496-Pyramimonas_sp.AAC.1